MDSDILHVITDEERAKLQKVLLGMLKDVIEACRQLNIDCTLIGGSVLGAVRHQGFIPWDDDLDIGMTRSEWNIFKEHFDSVLGNKYVLEAPNYNDKDSKQLLSKINLKDSEYVMIEEVNFPYINCIFLDVFIIDYVSDNCVVRSFDAFTANLMRLMAITMQEYKYPSPIMKEAMMSSKATKIYYFVRQIIGCFSSLLMSHKTLGKWFDRFVSRHRKPTKRATVATGLKRYRKETLDSNVWFPYSKGIFEGISVNLPHDPDKYLSFIYGEYMKLPPLEKRETHAIVKLKFLDDSDEHKTINSCSQAM